MDCPVIKSRNAEGGAIVPYDLIPTGTETPAYQQAKEEAAKRGSFKLEGTCISSGHNGYNGASGWCFLNRERQV